jgi:YidC/Oxa1 family membrane protein insertase
MDFQRLFLYLALFLISFLLWEAWQRENAPPPVPQTVATPSAGAPSAEVPADVPDTAAAAPSVPTPGAPAPAASGAGQVEVRTDVLDVVIDLAGGIVRESRLLQYPVSLEQKDTPFTLLESSARGVYLAQSGLLGTGLPDHHAPFTAPAESFRLEPGQDTLVVPLTWVDNNGVKVTKRYTFSRGNYLVKVDYRIENGGADPVAARIYGQLQRSAGIDLGGSRFAGYTYTGAAISSPDKRYEKIPFGDMSKQDIARDVPGGWAAMIQHYFISAWIPSREATNHYYTKALPGERYLVGLAGPTHEVAPGSDADLSLELYMGPKNQDRLARIADGLDLTVDYGWLWFIAQPLFWLLKWLHKLVGNWGWSIVLVTVIIKLAFYHLSATSYRSMANMRRMAPRLQSLKERYGDDKQRLNQAMMELYKKEKINPLGGCLPILVQIPVFISLYWVLLESVELRQAPFILWIHDLSIKDPYYVLPVLMGISMFIQQRLNPTPPDPIQAKVMMALPFVFTVFFAFFPAGLVVYWVVNNTLSIAQQWYITRGIEKVAGAHHA